MFKSIQYSNNNAFTIIDDDFIEYCLNNPEGLAKSVIDCYTRRNISVGKNLFLFLEWYYLKHKLPVSVHLSLLEKRLPALYKEDIEKYILLL
jgi:hypothetical protein